MAAKQSQRAEVNSFVQGLITEASPLNFPPNASAEEENFELNRDGSRQRRLGMDLEIATVFRDTGISVEDIDIAGFNSFKWIEVAGEPALEFLAVQFNRKIAFFDLTKENLSGSGFVGEVSLGSFPTNTRFSFASIEGFLVVAAGVDVIAKIKYDTNTLSFTTSYDRLMVRDVWGIEESDPRYDQDPTFRGALTPEHRYNLQNQSWGIPRFYSTPPGFYDPAQVYFNVFGVAPSNSETVYPGLQFKPFMGDEPPTEWLYPHLYEQTLGSNPIAARGYFIIDALRRGQSRAEKVAANNTKYTTMPVYPTDFPTDYTPGGASIVAEFAGRVFYSGFKGAVIDGDNKSPNYTNYVFFSQLTKNEADIVKCYQDGDPTSRDAPDIIDTDGGFLRISEAKEIIALINIGSSLIAIASNGVWSIDGGADYGFSASNYRVAKLSTFGGISATTVVVEGSRVYYWAEDGIYSIGKNELGETAVTNITVSTIQSLYEEIPTLSKAKASSVYDSLAKKVRWVYNSDNLMSEDNVTRELVLDTTIGAFSMNKVMNLDGDIVRVIEVFESSPYRTGNSEEAIYAGSEPVLVGGEQVVVLDSVEISGIKATKYIAIHLDEGTIKYAFSYYRNPNFIDWEAIDGVGTDAKAFCLTGSQTVGDSGVDKQIPYLIMHFTKTENAVDGDFIPINQSGCLIRCQWNFANSAVANKWTPLMQAYRYRKPLLGTSPGGSYNNGLEVITTKLKMRGKGKAFAMYFETEPRKDCRILGWSITLNANAIT